MMGCDVSEVGEDGNELCGDVREGIQHSELRSHGQVFPQLYSSHSCDVLRPATIK